MRVPNITTYSSSTYQLGNYASNLKDANEVVATQKRINSISDDPVGLSQVLNINTTLGNLEQISRNVEVGITWLEGVENALGSVNDLILDVKGQVSRLASASASADERKDAVESINGMIEQIVTLGNTQINGNYIFAGTDATAPPFVYNKAEDPPSVSYGGNEDPFKIRTDNNVTVEVGRAGSTTFWDDSVAINATNNTIVFKEDNGHGSASEKTLTATIPDGEYSAEALEALVGKALNEASAANGYGVTYEVAYDETENRFSIREDGSYDGYLRTRFLWETGNDARVSAIQASTRIDPDDINLRVLNKEALTIGTPEPAGTEPFKLTWDGKGGWQVGNNPGYIMASSIPGTADGVDLDLNEDGFTDISLGFATPVIEGESVEFEIVPAGADQSIGHEIGFHGGNMVYAPPVSDSEPAYITEITIAANDNDTIDFVETNAAGVSTTLSAVIDPGSYGDMDELALEIESKLKAASANNINYAVSYDPVNSRFNIREDGTDLNQLDFLWKSGANSTMSAGSALGFYPMDDSVTYPTSAVTIDSSNHIVDFIEENPAGTFTTLQAIVPSGIYPSLTDLAAAVETAMEDESAALEDYTVDYDPAVPGFSISAGGAVTSFNLLWASGAGAPVSIGETLGYDTKSDPVSAGLGPYSSDTAPMFMGLFSLRIDDTNNTVDFEEVDTLNHPITLQAVVPSGTYDSVADLEEAVAKAMDDASAASGNTVRYDVSYDEATQGFDISRSGGAALNEFNLLWASGSNPETSIGATLGYDPVDNTGGTGYSSTRDPAWISFDATNNVIDFRETTLDGKVSTVQRVEIPRKDYSDLDEVASEIQTALRSASPNNVQYKVLYDDASGFIIKGNDPGIKNYELLWNSGPGAESSAAETLGFDSTRDDLVAFADSDQAVVNLFIDSSNNKIDFREVISGNKGMVTANLTASITPKTYTSHVELGREVEKALEAESLKNGNRVDYSVSWDEQTRQFSIKEDGTRLEEFHLLWQTGENAPPSEGVPARASVPSSVSALLMTLPPLSAAPRPWNGAFLTPCWT